MSARKKLVEDEKINLDLMGAILHNVLEDDHIKGTRFGHQLYIEIELKDLSGKQFKMQGIIGNDDYVVTSIKFSDVEERKQSLKIKEEMKSVNDFNNAK